MYGIPYLFNEKFSRVSYYSRGWILVNCAIFSDFRTVPLHVINAALTVTLLRFICPVLYTVSVA